MRVRLHFSLFFHKRYQHFSLCSYRMFTGSPTGSLTTVFVDCDIQSIKEKDLANGVFTVTVLCDYRCRHLAVI